MGEEPSCTTPTLPRGFVRWHERRGLLASGLHSPSRFPSGDEWSAGLEGQLPVTVAGARRGFSRLPGGPLGFFFFSTPVYLFRHPAAQEGGEGRGGSTPPPGGGGGPPPPVPATHP